MEDTQPFRPELFFPMAYKMKTKGALGQCIYVYICSPIEVLSQRAIYERDT